MRFLFGVLLASVTTLGLLLLMHSLISSDDIQLQEKSGRKLADILMPEREIKAQRKERKPEKPEQPEEAPPEVQQPQLQDVNVELEPIQVAAPANMEVKLQAGLGLSATDGEYLPISKIAPEYPRRAQSRGIQGYCTVEYTVTKSGAVRDPKPVDCQPAGIFERASVRAALKFKYKPRVVDGEPVEVVGVQNRFTFKLED